MKEVTIGGSTRRIEPFSGRKVNRVLRLLKKLAREVPELLDKRAAFIRDYESRNYVELDRAQALLRYGAPVAVQGPDGAFVRNDAGGLETVQSPLLSMTEDAWARSDHKLRLPRSPGIEEQAWALFPDVFDKAEETTVQLLALVLLSNADTKSYARDGSLDEKLAELGEDLLDDSMGDELLELAVVAGELVDDQLLSKARQLRTDGRLGNLGRLFGMTIQESPTPTSSPAEQTHEQTQNLSTDSPEPSDGDPTPPSTPTTTPSTSSASS